MRMSPRMRLWTGGRRGRFRGGEEGGGRGHIVASLQRGYGGSVERVPRNQRVSPLGTAATTSSHRRDLVLGSAASDVEHQGIALFAAEELTAEGRLRSDHHHGVAVDFDFGAAGPRADEIA